MHYLTEMENETVKIISAFLTILLYKMLTATTALLFSGFEILYIIKDFLFLLCRLGNEEQI